jgi:hypothetical protein
LKVKKGTKILVKVNDLPKGSDIKLPKYCDICGIYIGMRTNETINRNRKKGDGKDYCRTCSGIKISNALINNFPYEKSIQYVAPNLINEWIFDKNDKKLDKVNAYSGIEYWWKCLDCKSEYLKSPYDKIIKKHKCSYCSGRKVNETNCLATLHPELIKDWHPSKNEKITPYNMTLGSGKLIWWICKKCGSEYDTTIQNKISYTTPCPYCAGSRVNHINCLSTTHPKLAKQWHPTLNNLSPHEVTSGSHKKVWWICPKKDCNNVWEAEIKSRLISGCPACNESKGEKKIKRFLEINNIVFQREYEFTDLIGLGGGFLRFDFAILNKQKELVLLVEYDGEYHYKNFYKDGTYEILKTHDNLKNAYCKNNNIPLLRIPYWDFKNIDNIINKELIKYEIKTVNEVEI